MYSKIVINSNILIKIILLIIFKIQEKFLKSMINCFIWEQRTNQKRKCIPTYDTAVNSMIELIPIESEASHEFDRENNVDT